MPEIFEICHVTRYVSGSCTKYSPFRDWMSQNQSQGGLVSENRTTDNPPTIGLGIPAKHGQVGQAKPGFPHFADVHVALMSLRLAFPLPSL